MSVTAIISEYNPFHNGHLYQIEQAKKITGCSHIVSIMSGNYVQRGEPALLDKYTRSKMCLMNGVDICLEIPLYYVLSSAQNYALGAVKILDSLGFVDYLCFGSECGDLNLLSKIAAVLADEPDEYKEMLTTNISNGLSYAKAVEISLYEYTKNEEIKSVVNKPNNILAIEYLKALRLINSKITPITIKRKGAMHDSFDSTETSPEKENNTAICSASKLRYLILNNNNESNIPYKYYLPKNTIDIFDVNNTFPQNKILSDIFYYNVMYKDSEYFSKTNQSNEFIANKLLKINGGFCSIDDAAHSIKSKDIAYSRIKRIIISSILNITNDDVKNVINSVPYVKLLGIHKNSSFLLSNIKENEKVLFLTKWNIPAKTDKRTQELIKKEITANDLYYHLCNQTVVEKQKNIIIL